MALPLAAGFACSSKETVTPAATSIPTPTKEDRPYGGSQDIVDKVVDRFGGAVIFTAKGLDPNEKMIVNFERVDIPESQQQDIDSENMEIGNNQTTVFAATSCKGKFSVSVSLDEGRSYTILPVPDIVTREPLETFELKRDCTRPITFTLLP